MNDDPVSGGFLVVDENEVVGSRRLGISNVRWAGMPQDDKRSVLEHAVDAMKSIGIPAETRLEVPDARPGSLGLVLPILRLYLPVKELGKEFFGAVMAAAFVVSMGASPTVAASALAPESLRILVMKLRSLTKEELEVVRAVIMLAENDPSLPTSDRLSLELGWDAESTIKKLVNRLVLRSDGEAWRVEF